MSATVYIAPFGIIHPFISHDKRDVLFSAHLAAAVYLDSHLPLAHSLNSSSGTFSDTLSTRQGNVGRSGIAPCTLPPRSPVVVNGAVASS